MPNIITVPVSMQSRSTKEPLPGDNGASSLHVCMAAKDRDTGELGYSTLEGEPFYMPDDQSTVVVLKIRAL